MATEAYTITANVVNQLEVTDCAIVKLADETLPAIFKHLPPFERLIVSEVCTNWRDISHAPWRDVTRLDLSQVPTENINAVIKKCPDLISVSALRQHLGDWGRFVSRLENITSLKCVECTFTIDRNSTRFDVDASIRSASWQEVIWHNSKTLVTESVVRKREYPPPARNPPTLRRLQISGTGLSNSLNAADPENLFVDACQALRQLPLLESCILADWGSFTDEGFARCYFTAAVCLHLAVATNLRELYFDSANGLMFLHSLVPKLPELQILYLNNIELWDMLTHLAQHPSLRVLVLTASCSSDFNGEVLIPTRKLFPNGLDSPPVPQLHLFLGKIAAEKLRFHPSPSDALKIYPINAPLPEFLEKEEIKAIFEGSWIASRIKDGAKEGVNLADYSFEGNAESISYV